MIVKERRYLPGVRVALPPVQRAPRHRVESAPWRPAVLNVAAVGVFLLALSGAWGLVT